MKTENTQTEKKQSFPERSTRQNAFYWGSILPAIVESLTEFEMIEGEEKKTTLDKETLHEYLKQKFVKGRSTKKMFADEFSEYIENVILFAIEITNKVKSIKDENERNKQQRISSVDFTCDK